MILNLSSISTLFVIVGALVALVNIIVQVIKKVTWDKVPTNLLVVIISIALTVIAFFAYCQIVGIIVIWYMVVGAVVVGWMVSYAAMFGFDKFKEAFSPVADAVQNTSKNDTL